MATAPSAPVEPRATSTSDVDIDALFAQLEANEARRKQERVSIFSKVLDALGGLDGTEDDIAAPAAIARVGRVGATAAKCRWLVPPRPARGFWLAGSSGPDARGRVSVLGARVGPLCVLHRQAWVT